MGLFINTDVQQCVISFPCGFYLFFWVGEKWLGKNAFVWISGFIFHVIITIAMLKKIPPNLVVHGFHGRPFRQVTLGLLTYLHLSSLFFSLILRTVFFHSNTFYTCILGPVPTYITFLIIHTFFSSSISPSQLGQPHQCTNIL